MDLKRVTEKKVDWEEVLIQVRRVTRVTKGGRHFSFCVLVLVSNGIGSIGYGMAKHAEVVEAKDKAIRKAKKCMIKISLRENRTIHHQISSKFGASKVFMKPAVAGTGIIAGGTLRKFCEIIGITDVIAKSYGSSCPHLMVRHLCKIFKTIIFPAKYFANKREMKVSEMLNSKRNSLSEARNSENGSLLHN